MAQVKAMPNDTLIIKKSYSGEPIRNLRGVFENIFKNPGSLGSRANVKTNEDGDEMAIPGLPPERSLGAVRVVCGPGPGRSRTRPLPFQGISRGSSTLPACTHDALVLPGPLFPR